MGFFQTVQKAIDNGAQVVVTAGEQAATKIADAASQGAAAIADAGQGAASTVSDAGQKSGQLWSEVESAVDAIAAAGRRAADVVAAEGRRAADTVAQEARRLAGTVTLELRRDNSSVNSFSASDPSRRLTDAEKALARTVFGDSVPLERVWLSPRFGVTGPFTVPNSDGTYTIHAGGFFANFFEDPLSTTKRSTNGNGFSHANVAFFVHELTHVWQGEHWAHTGDYVANAIAHLTGTRVAYSYEPGRTWKDYSAEQQAMIVEDWFATPFESGDPGESMAQTDTSPRFKYIRDNIRKGINDPKHPRNAVS